MVEKQRINHTDSNFSCILLLLGWMNYGNFVQKSQCKVDTTGAYFQNYFSEIIIIQGHRNGFSPDQNYS